MAPIKLTKILDTEKKPIKKKKTGSGKQKSATGNSAIEPAINAEKLPNEAISSTASRNGKSSKPEKDKSLEKHSTKISEQLPTYLRALADANPLLKGLIDRVDFNATTHGQRDIDDDRLSNLIEAISAKRLGLSDMLYE